MYCECFGKVGAQESFVGVFGIRHFFDIFFIMHGKVVANSPTKIGVNWTGESYYSSQKITYFCCHFAPNVIGTIDFRFSSSANILE